jgi:hypothetical protein
MPNWCNNAVTISGKAKKIDEFEKFLDANEGKNFFDYFLPMPDELIGQGEEWYSWAINNWGCKWNCDASDWVVESIDKKTKQISFWFDSPWGPPLALYSEIEKVGLEIVGNYHEEGMGFVGQYKDGYDDYHEYRDIDDLDLIPEEIVEYWNLKEMLEDRELHNDLDELSDTYWEMSEDEQKIIQETLEHEQNLMSDEEPVKGKKKNVKK